MTLQKDMSEKEKRMLKAARKRWQENKDLQTVANELNLAYKTVRNYFSGDKMQRFERYYSESEKQLIDAQLEQMIKDGTSTALDIRSDLQSSEEVDARIKAKVMKEAQKIPERHIKMLQELGIISKPENGKEENGDKDTKDLRKDLAEIYEKYHGGLPVMEAGGGEG
jgi:membrane-associated HD superfamily phosphohydrolase